MSYTYCLLYSYCSLTKFQPVKVLAGLFIVLAPVAGPPWFPRNRSPGPPASHPAKVSKASFAKGKCAKAACA